MADFTSFSNEPPEAEPPRAVTEGTTSASLETSVSLGSASLSASSKQDKPRPATPPPLHPNKATTPPPPSSVARKTEPQQAGSDTKEEDSPRRFSWSSPEVSSFQLSFALHAMLMVLLALWYRGGGIEDGPLDLNVRLETVVSEPDIEIENQAILPSALPREGETPPQVRPLAPSLIGDPREAITVIKPMVTVGFGPTSPQTANVLAPNDADVRGAFKNRTHQGRAQAVANGETTAAAESAVERGLKWIVVHQLDDGGWDFDLTKSYCKGQCRNSGTELSRTAATSLALLPFFGASYTHLEGEHKTVIRRGLYYLGSHARLSDQGADLRDGTMYGQGLATIALCEAYGMTKEEGLRDLAQSAIDFIVNAQDTTGGGWRYTPKAPGDTTVSGWQLMALKSAQMAGLDVPSPVIFRMKRFLDSVQTKDGSEYGYMSVSPSQTTTSVGLLCRMYTGWQRNRAALRQGVVYRLARWGPSDSNMYYNYYATQVLHHWGGEEWRQWNQAMRNYLLSTQASRGHEAGSWYFSGGRGDVGGRLYNTAMAIMTLEVSYRYMPLYRSRAIGEDQ